MVSAYSSSRLARSLIAYPVWAFNIHLVRFLSAYSTWGEPTIALRRSSKFMVIEGKYILA